MKNAMRERRIWWLIALTAAVAMAFPAPASARRSRDTLGSLVGTWTGSGSIVSGNGKSEPIRCRATYSGSEGALQQSLTCASASFRLDVAGQIRQQGDQISGQWQETTRGISGGLSGTVGGNRITGNVTGAGFSVGLGITLRGNRHTVSLTPSSGDIRSLSVSFRR